MISLASDAEAVRVVIRAGEAVECEALPFDAVDREGDASLLIRGGVSLVRLFVGDDHPGRIISQGTVTVAGPDSWLVSVLFPHEEPDTLLWDRF